MSGEPCLTFQAMTASRTTPTLCVLVIMTGPLRNPESSTQVVPVISPLPLRVNQATKRVNLVRRTCDGDMRASGKAGSIRHAKERKVAAFGALRAAGRYNRSNVGLFWGERLWIHGRKRWSSVRPARQRFCL